MLQTKPLFLTDTYLHAIEALITDAGMDEIGKYVILDQTIFYPQGGGQPNDKGYLTIGNKDYKIISAKYDPNSNIRHYIEIETNIEEIKEKTVVMRIFEDFRLLHASYHSAGHWLSQIISENLQLPLIPVKGHHFPGEAYMEFEGDINGLPDDIINQIETAILIDKQANLKITAEFADADSKIFKTALLPKNFKLPENKPLRFVTIETYKPIPCGGTHLNFVRAIKLKIKDKPYKKGNRVRLPYECSIQSYFPD